MRNAVLFVSILFFYLCCSSYKVTEKRAQSNIKNGYVIFIGDENIIFVPYEKPQANMSFKELEKKTGFSIRGYVSDELDSLKRIGRNYNVEIRLIDREGGEEVVGYSFIIISAQLDYEIKSQTIADSSAVPFMYKQKQYLINYTFNYGLSVSGVRPYFKKDINRLKNLKAQNK
jgi:hypothetical protein